MALCIFITFWWIKISLETQVTVCVYVGIVLMGLVLMGLVLGDRCAS